MSKSVSVKNMIVSGKAGVIIVSPSLLKNMSKRVRKERLDRIRSAPPIRQMAIIMRERQAVGSISLEIMTALFVISLTFAAFIHVADHLNYQGYLLRVRGEGMTALKSQYEMAALGVSYLPQLPSTLRICQHESDIYQRLWLASAAACHMTDPMSLVVRKPSP